MLRGVYTLAILGALASAAWAIGSAQSSQYPMIDKVAAKVVSHYQNSSCQQIAAAKQQPPSGQQAQAEQHAIQYLHQNPQAAQYFISKVATPIANKLFQCGMIP
jgi:Flp pilus assembly protein CpaB